MIENLDLQLFFYCIKFAFHCGLGMLSNSIIMKFLRIFRSPNMIYLAEQDKGTRSDKLNMKDCPAGVSCNCQLGQACCGHSFSLFLPC